jgi:phage protein U
MLLLGDYIELPARAIREVRDETGATWPTHEVISGKPRRQYMGPTGDKLTLSLFLHVSFLVPADVLGTLRTLAANGAVFQLWTRAGVFLGTFFIEQVSARSIAALPDGRAICAYCDLTLSDPGLELPDEPEQPLALETSAQDTVVAPSPEDLSRPPEDFSPQEIARV